MTKRRNPHAVDAWMRHGGAHDPGSKKPEVDERTDIADGIDEALEDAETEFLEGLVAGGGYIEVDGELLEIEWDWEADDEEE